MLDICAKNIRYSSRELMSWNSMFFNLTQFDMSSLSGKITVLNGTQDLPPNVAQVLTLCGSRKYP